MSSDWSSSDDCWSDESDTCPASLYDSGSDFDSSFSDDDCDLPAIPNVASDTSDTEDDDMGSLPSLDFINQVKVANKKLKTTTNQSIPTLEKPLVEAPTNKSEFIPALPKISQPQTKSKTQITAPPQFDDFDDDDDDDNLFKSPPPQSFNEFSKAPISFKTAPFSTGVPTASTSVPIVAEPILPLSLSGAPPAVLPPPTSSVHTGVVSRSTDDHSDSEWDESDSEDDTDYKENNNSSSSPQPSQTSVTPSHLPSSVPLSEALCSCACSCGARSVPPPQEGLCANCESSLATMRCEACNEDTCGDCCRVLHLRRVRRSHHVKLIPHIQHSYPSPSSHTHSTETELTHSVLSSPSSVSTPIPPPSVPDTSVEDEINSKVKAGKSTKDASVVSARLALREERLRERQLKLEEKKLKEEEKAEKKKERAALRAKERERERRFNAYNHHAEPESERKVESIGGVAVVKVNKSVMDRAKTKSKSERVKEGSRKVKEKTTTDDLFSGGRSKDKKERKLKDEEKEESDVEIVPVKTKKKKDHIPEDANDSSTNKVRRSKSVKTGLENMDDDDLFGGGSKSKKSNDTSTVERRKKEKSENSDVKKKTDSEITVNKKPRDLATEKMLAGIGKEGDVEDVVAKRTLTGLLGSMGRRGGSSLFDDDEPDMF